MAWSSAALAAQETTDFAADHPIAVGLHALSGTALAAEWNNLGTIADTDDSATGYPAANAGDFRGSVPTKPNAALATWYWVADLGASGVPDVDMALLMGHNMGTLGGMTVTLEIADTSDFTGGTFQTIATWTPGSSSLRLIEYALKHTGAVALRYTGLRYVRLKFVNAGAVTPSFGELWLGRRRQLGADPAVGYDEREAHGTASDFQFDDGTSLRYSWNGDGPAMKAVRFPALSSTDATLALDLRDDCKRGTRPILWCDQPSTAPNRTLLMLPPVDLRRATLGGGKRALAMDLREQDTFREAES